jgi:hypothetical protein
MAAVTAMSSPVAGCLIHGPPIGLTISLDGFIAAPHDGLTNPLGDGGGRLFDWWTAGEERLGPDDIRSGRLFLLPHRPADQYVGPGTDGTVVTDGIRSALEQARAMAREGDIAVGSADVAQQHPRGRIGVTHLRYRVVHQPAGHAPASYETAIRG